MVALEQRGDAKFLRSVELSISCRCSRQRTCEVFLNAEMRFPHLTMIGEIPTLPCTTFSSFSQESSYITSVTVTCVLIPLFSNSLKKGTGSMVASGGKVPGCSSWP